MHIPTARPTRTETGYQLGDFMGELGKGLAPREVHVVLCKANGLTEKESARILECSANNITQTMQRVLYKLKAHRSTDAVSHAFQRGIIHFGVIALAVLIGCQSPTTNNPIFRSKPIHRISKIKARARRNGDLDFLLNNDA